MQCQTQPAGRSFSRASIGMLFVYAMMIFFIASCVNAAQTQWEPLIQETPASLPQLQAFLSEIPPSFKLKADDKTPLATCEPLMARVTQARKMSDTLGKQAMDEGQKAELAELTAALKSRARPIIHQYLASLTLDLPRDFRGIKKDRMNIIKVRVIKAIPEAVYFIKAYPKAPELTEVKFYLANLLFLNSSVALKLQADLWEKQHKEKPPAEIRGAWKEKYFDQIFSLMKPVLPDTKLPDAIMERAVKLQADSLASMHKRKEAAELYMKHLRRWPNSVFVKTGVQWLNIAQNYLYAQMPEPAAKILAEGAIKSKGTLYHPYVMNVYFKALKATGQLEKAKALAIELGKLGKTMAKKPGVDKFTKNGFKTFSEWSLFRVGYMEFAMGEHEKAKESFRQHIEYIKKLQKDGAAINPATTVYTQRSTDLLNFLQTYVMQPAPELTTKWAFDRPFKLSDNPMKVIAIMFRGYGPGQRRSHPALVYLQEQYKAHGFDAGPLAVACVNYAKGEQDMPGQIAQVEQEATDLGLTFPVGIEAAKAYKAFSEYGVNIGSATLVIIDPLGRIAYYEQDPMPNAFGLFKRVIDSLLKG